MNTIINKTLLYRALACAGLAASGAAIANGDSGFDITVGGFIRPEIAVPVGGSDNPFNQRGNTYNGVTVTRTSPIATDTVTRNGGTEDNSLNLNYLRGELNVDMKLSSSWSATAKLRAIFDPASGYSEFSPNRVGSNAVGRVYGSPNYFLYDVEGKSHANPLEWAGENYLLYLPALFLNYNSGALDLRIGNQQIAWGQALFFRVLDVPNGLDLRRHSVLDYAPEEFSDKRVPGLGVRLSYQFQNNMLFDSFVQKFQPNILGNPNTPYNVIASQFTVHDRYSEYDKKVNYGFRLKGEVGDLGLQMIAARRYNPEGVYRWTASGVNRDIPGLAGTGAVLAQTPFEVDPTGVWSATEWFDYAARARLNGTTALNAAINDFPASALLGAVAVPNQDYARAELDQFFQLAGGLLAGQSAGGLRGHIERRYFQETNVGGGLSYVFNGEPNSLTDQLIMNFELLYTPNRVFTAPSLGKDFITKNEWTSALVFEKNHRFSDSFPATYLVFQWLHKSQSDLFGRYLGGYEGTAAVEPPGKDGGYNAFAFAVQQPFPNLIWRADLSVLYDAGGGILIQPGIRWKPNGRMVAEVFYNYVNGKLGGNPNKNALSTVDYADELTFRLSYQF